MAKATDHHITSAMVIPYSDIGLSPVAKRPVPVAVIYDLKKLAKPAPEPEPEIEQPDSSRGSMFFLGRKRNIENDPFLKRLSRLK